MSKSKGIYKKAIKNFQIGKINKSLEQVELAISENMKNSSALNLKGLILYLKGDLKGAELAWKINKDFNDDNLSKSYLKDLNDDRNRKNIYENSLKLIKQMKITEAIEELSICRQSDFNAINVYNALSFCYIKKGDYKAAESCISKVLSIELDNKTAKDNKKILEEYGVIAKREINKKVFLIPIALIIILGIGYGGYKYFPKKISKDKVETAKVVKTPVEKQKEPQIKLSGDTEKTKTKFNSIELQKAIDENRFEDIYNILNNTDEKGLGVNDKSVYEAGKQIISSKGVEYFYNKGREDFKNSDFGKANKDFLKSYKYVENGYLRPHIIYLTGLSYEKNNDYENALKYYEKYVNENETGDYVEEVLYKLSTIYYKIDKQKAKTYASKLVNSYPNSIYNNTTLKQILQ
ncbi:Tetratricopeptide repeat-containing protein [Clostridium cavendishii DSM 21758]|uniref:Tetratricopeptide repeat-containing protein n=1 Tax=Clostridium cavendishii DSM 21758 TaxID=1121302 RepID=A0A1M6LZ24_9CLOT|nr:tetratricopeptide repeat protein [Clostridium cavendishii]SHJ76464.1 Tetratricopeptide repeat-containing protein [Clostridium cavendishii DSM 21758]